MRLFTPDGREMPLINGIYYSYSSIELVFRGRIYLGVTEITYGSALKPGEIIGQSTRRIGRTPGNSSHRCSLEMYRGLFDEFIGALGPSYGRVLFDLAVTYAEDGEATVTDNVRGVRITDVDLSNHEGTDPLTVKLTLDPTDIELGKDKLSIDGTSAAKPSIPVVA